MVKDLTQGNPLKLILLFSLPLLFGNLFQQFYNMADTVIVGQFLGVKALAGVGSTGSLSFLVIGFVLGLCSGFGIPIAQYFGAGDKTKMRRCVTHSIYLASAITVILTIVTLLMTRQILQLMHTPEDILEYAYSYIIIIFAGIGATMFYNLMASMLRAVGDTKTPLYFLILATILNILLDLLFILVFSMGVAGAAFATVLAQIVSGLLCWFYIAKQFPILHLSKEDFVLDRFILGRLLAMGLPMAFQFSITAIGSILLQSAVNSLGSDIVASVTAASKVQSIVVQPMETLGITMATYCGQNFGAKKIDRIRIGIRQSSLVSIGYCIFAGVIIVLFGQNLAMLFLKPEETAILIHVKEYLNITATMYPILGILFIIRNSLQGLGYALPAMTAGVFELVARSLVAFCLIAPFGYRAVCFANPIAWIAADILLIPVYVYVLRKWKKAGI